MILLLAPHPAAVVVVVARQSNAFAAFEWYSMCISATNESNRQVLCTIAVRIQSNIDFATFRIPMFRMLMFCLVFRLSEHGLVILHALASGYHRSQHESSYEYDFHWNKSDHRFEAHGRIWWLIQAVDKSK